jgi:hypothetical protein
MNHGFTIGAAAILWEDTQRNGLATAMKKFRKDLIQEGDEDIDSDPGEKAAPPQRVRGGDKSTKKPGAGGRENKDPSSLELASK